MGENSSIEWTDHTHNFWVGCQKVSPACDFCYAESWAKRTGHPELWQGERRRTTPENWAKPLRWNRAHRSGDRRQRVFCNSLADFFDNQIDPQWRNDAWGLIARTPNLDWLILTKRPQNIAGMLPPDWGNGWPNVWLGTTVENQEEADRRIPHLLGVPVAVRFLSCEPLLGPVDLGRRYEVPWTRQWHAAVLRGETPPVPAISWVIGGGESGPGARPAHPDWFRNLRDQCAMAGVPFFFKQWGEFVAIDQAPDPDASVLFQRPYVESDDLTALHSPPTDWIEESDRDEETTLVRIGKKAAGRLLDGRSHDDMPNVRHG